MLHTSYIPNYITKLALPLFFWPAFVLQSLTYKEHFLGYLPTDYFKHFQL